MILMVILILFLTAPSKCEITRTFNIYDGEEIDFLNIPKSENVDNVIISSSTPNASGIINL